MIRKFVDGIVLVCIYNLYADKNVLRSHSFSNAIECYRTNNSGHTVTCHLENVRKRNGLFHSYL